ncbi:major facilitator superfamily transporter [Colletotrichum orchidophilum]|uniref:Major facilitator superfamily transporter n=1 Tax=Colletotrichum orchidophilum TaxID=1209926 RepID=A0A1G4AYA6_9PEZI|nr:major facilitator superfamily transporter [Colletotrichum orchidophilum]OHE94063.1 major facilitator superfamily transporter [Colletotrichum orchidophilum]
MDAKDSQPSPRNAVSLESLHPIEPSVVVDVDDKKDGPVTASASAPPTISNVAIDEEDAQVDPESSHAADETLKRRARWALFVMAFFMGDVAEGLGPFLGVYLQQHGWAPGLRGMVSTAGGVATIIATGPIGALIDATKYKRLLVASCALLVSVSQGLNLLSTHPALVFSTQIVSAVAGTSMMPLLVALTLGICSPEPEGSDAQNKKSKHSFRALNGRNQAANHAGNMVSAGLAGLLGSRFGLNAVFYLVMAFDAMTIGCVFLLPERAIDHAAARGGPAPNIGVTDAGAHQMQERGREEADDVVERGGLPPPGTPIVSPKTRSHRFSWKHKFSFSWLKIFQNNWPLGIVAVTIFMFHLGNAAILFIYGQALVAAGEGDPAGTTGLTVIIAQGTMVIVSILSAWASGRYGYWSSILLSYTALPIRAAVAGRVMKSWGVWPVQILDGVGAGIQSVAIPGLLAVMMAGTGHVNVTMSIVGGITRQTGAAISHSLAGWVAQVRGYSFALYLLGVFPLVSVFLWAGFYKILRPVMDKKPGGE